LSLVLKTDKRLRIAASFIRVKDLKHDVSLESAIDCLINRTHATRAELLCNFKTIENDRLCLNVHSGYPCAINSSLTYRSRQCLYWRSQPCMYAFLRLGWSVFLKHPAEPELQFFKAMLNELK